MIIYNDLLSKFYLITWNCAKNLKCVLYKNKYIQYYHFGQNVNVFLITVYASQFTPLIHNYIRLIPINNNSIHSVNV